MGHTRQSLAKDLGALGLGTGAIVMVHASVRAVGKVYGGPDEIHLAITDAIGPSGTMMMVVGCPDGFDEVGRGRLTREEEDELLANMPPFDPATTRAGRDIGTLAEFFRSYPGAVCSESVVRFCARGGCAAWLMRDQPWSYAFGHGSPLEKLVEAGGKLLLLGCDHDTVTLMHHVEHVTDFPGKRIVRVRVPVLQNGRREWVGYEEFDSSDDGVHANWPSRFFAIITDAFIDEFEGTDVCRTGRVGDADTALIDARTLVRYAAPLMVEQANKT
jgi:aminoglycoside 3-N-acetyltransferase